MNLLTRIHSLSVLGAVLLLGLFCGEPPSPVANESYPNFGVQFVDSRHGWILGPVLYSTSDGGATWTRVANSDRSPIYADDGPEYRKFYLQFVARNRAWRIDPNDLRDLQLSTDGGSSWSKSVRVADNHSLSGVLFSSIEQGLAFGESLYFSGDSGATWGEVSEVSDFEFYHPFFFDHRNGWVAGRGKIARTNDGGRTWQVHNRFPIKARYVYFASAEAGWAIGLDGLLAFSSDGGLTWQDRDVFGPPTPKRMPNLLGIFFQDTDRGWITTQDGRILRTIDGGRRWLETKTPTNAPLSSIYFLDSQRGWAVGGNPEPATPTGSPSRVSLQTVDGGESWHLLKLDK